MRLLRSLSVLLLFFGMAWTAAQLEIDPAGGPLTLAEDVTAALEIWERAFAPEELEEPTASIAFAPELLGPDTSSLTLLYSDGRTEVLLAPSRYDAAPVLVHEIGVLLGLPATRSGVMDPAIDADTPGAPTDADIELLRDLRTYPAADLTRDGVVDFYDLAAFGEAYGSVGINLRADLNGDGRVDEADLEILAESYAFSPPSRSAPAPQNLAPAVGTPPQRDQPADAAGGEVSPDENPDASRESRTEGESQGDGETDGGTETGTDTDTETPGGTEERR